MTPRHTAARSAAPIALLVLALMVGLVVASADAFRAGALTAEGGAHAGDTAPVPPTTAAPAPTTTVRTAVPVVAVVGDSLAYSAATALGAALRAVGADPVLRVAPGRRIPVWGLVGQISPGLDEA